MITIIRILTLLLILRKFPFIYPHNVRYNDDLLKIGSGNEKWGVVLVDLRSDDNISDRMRKSLKRLAEISPHVEIELWIHETMNITNVLRGPNVHVKHLNIPTNSLIKFRRGETGIGYLSKVYALQSTEFPTAVYFDSEVWLCEGWEKVLNETLRNYSAHDLLWTTEECSFCDYYYKRNDVFVSRDVRPSLEKYKKYTERNTGTIMVLRRNNYTDEFLLKAIEIYRLHGLHGSHGYSKTDQAPMREAAFIMRNQLREALLPESTWCRSQKSAFYGDSSKCECNLCSVVHMLGWFEKCTKDYLLS